MRSIFITVIIFVFSAAVFGQAGKISGTVTLSDDGSVMHQVSIQIAELKRTVFTDKNGYYEFSNVPPGKYTIHAHQEGFNDASQKVEILAGGSETVDIKLSIAGLKEQVTVTASGTEESTFQAIASVSTLDSSQITARAAVGLGDVLDNQAGVTKRSSGPGNSRPVIRGFDGDRVMVTNDGVSVGSLASQSGDHAEPVDTLAVDRIEVVKGPATLLYGSNAIGGIVNAISGHDEENHPGFRGYVSTIGGTNSSQAALSGGIEYGIGRWMLWGSGSGQRTGDYTAGGDFGKVVNSFTRNATGTGGFGYYADKFFFNTNYNYYQSRYGIPLDIFEENPEDRSLNVHRNNVKFNLGFRDVNSFVTGGKFTVDLSRYKHTELEDDIVGTTFRNNVDSYRAMFDQKKYGKWTGRFGFQGFQRRFSTVGTETLIDGPVVQDSFAVFALEELKFERVSLQFGARIENNRHDPKNPEYVNRSFTGFSGAAGARFDLWKGGAFVANYTHAYRAPALEELYNNGPHDGTLTFEIGNPNLRAEVSDGIDFSLRQQNKKLRAEATFYYYKFRDFVFLAPTGETDEDSGFSIAEYLQGDSRFMGTELSVDYTATNWLNILSGLDYVSAELSDGTPLPRIAPLRGRFGLDLHYKNLSVKPEVIGVADQNKVFVNETRTPGYAVFNVAGSYVISQQHFAHVFSVNAFNLTDKLYYNHNSFIKNISPEIGRGVRLSYTMRFF